MCQCAKFDQFLPSRSHFGSKRPENFVRIAKFPYAAFGPLFAFHCPLFFTRNNDLECKSSRFAAVDCRFVADKQLHLNGVIHSAGVAQCQELSAKTYVAECIDHGSNPVQGTIICFHFYCLRLARLTFNKS